MNVKFYKLHVAGRDAVLVDFTSGEMPQGDIEPLARRILSRRRGVGGSFFCVMDLSASGSFRLRKWDRRGNQANADGDAALCAARYAFDSGKASGRSIPFVVSGGTALVEMVDATALRTTIGPPAWGFPSIVARPRDFGNDETGRADTSGDGDSSRIAVVSGGQTVYGRAFVLGKPFLCQCHEGHDVAALSRLVRASAGIKCDPVPVAVRVMDRDELSVQVSPGSACDASGIAGAALVTAKLDGMVDRAAAVKVGKTWILADWEGPGSRLAVSAEPEYTFEGEYFFSDQIPGETT